MLKEEKIAINDMFEIPLFSAPDFNPKNQNEFIYVKTVVSKEKNTYLSSIISFNTITNEEVEIVPPCSSNYYPKWSSSGDSILFLSNRTGTAQAYLYDLKNKKVRQQTFTKYGVEHILWHPDNRHFYFGTVGNLGEKNLYWNEDKKTNNDEKLPIAYITDDLRYKMNGRGLIQTGEEDMWCFQGINETQAEIICDYNQGYGLKLPADISSDGNYLALERRIEKDNPFNFDSGVFVLDIHQGTWERITTETGAYGEPVFSPNNESIVMIGNSLPYLTSNEFRIFHYDLKKKKLENILEKEDVQVTDFGVSDYKLLNTNRQVQWNKKGNKVLFLVSVEGRVAIYSIDIDSKLVTKVHYDLEHVVDFDLSKQNETMVLISTSPKEPTKISIVDLADNKKRMLKKSGVLRSWADYHEVEYIANDGGRVPGFIAFPNGHNKDEKLPLILNIHGGPYTMHASTFHHEVQHMTSEGYAVLLLNPRGSFGYGQKHIDGVINRYGKEDYTDLLSGLDQALVEFPEIDSNQLYIAGGSYGGYLTNWIVTRDHRFKAGVTQRSMVNLVSMIGTSDNGYFFNVSESGSDIKNPQKLWEESPIAYVENIETPLLILHSEEDYRCPMEQAEQLFVALKYLGKESRFVRFPKSNHELSRSGFPNFRVQRLEEMMSWIGKY